MSERIDEHDLPFHRRIVAQVQRATRAQATIRELSAQVAEADAALKVWAAHLHEKHNLGPGDGINEEGLIVRVADQQPDAAGLDLDGRSSW